MKLIQRLVCVAMFVFFVAQVPAHAQRGGHMPDLPQDPAPKNNLTGFPGFFDTNTLPARTFLAEVPPFSLDYGLTPRISLGVNALSGLTLLSASPILYVKSRFKIFSGESFASTLTGYGLFIYASGNSTDGTKPQTESSTAYAGFLTHNTTYYVSEDLHLHVSLITGRAHAGSGTQGDIKYASLDAYSFMAATGATYFLNNNLDFQGIFLWNVHNSVLADSSAIYANITFKQKSPVVFRFATELTLKEVWLISAYLWASNQPLLPGVVESRVLPWAGVGFRW